MFRNRSTARYALLVGSSAMLLVAVSLPAQGAPKTKSGTTTSTTTAQAVNVQLNAAGSFLVIDNFTYAFDEIEAASYFTTVVTGPAVSCDGNATNCAATNQPAEPAAPTADDSRRNNGGVDNMCTFADGGALHGLAPYDQSTTTVGKNGRGNWKFTWTYTVTPKSPEPVKPLTAWDQVDSAISGTARIVVNGLIAAESSMTSAQFPSKDGVAPGKVSFSLDPSRIQSVTIRVQGKTKSGEPIDQTQYPMFTIIQGTDFSFLAPTSINGTNPLLYGPSAMNDVLLKDSTTTNDSAANLYFASLSAVGFDLAPGDYTFTLTGTVKDVATNTGGAAFTVTQVVHINTQGCGTTS